MKEGEGSSGRLEIGTLVADGCERHKQEHQNTKRTERAAASARDCERSSNNSYAREGESCGCCCGCPREELLRAEKFPVATRGAVPSGSARSFSPAACGAIPGGSVRRASAAARGCWADGRRGRPPAELGPRSRG